MKAAAESLITFTAHHRRSNDLDGTWANNVGADWPGGMITRRWFPSRQKQSTATVRSAGMPGGEGCWCRSSPQGGTRQSAWAGIIVLFRVAPSGCQAAEHCCAPRHQAVHARTDGLTTQVSGAASGLSIFWPSIIRWKPWRSCRPSNQQRRVAGRR